MMKAMMQILCHVFRSERNNIKSEEKAMSKYRNDPINGL